jgi:hypothetical protein
MTTVLVSGAMANKHRNGGEAWVRLHWVLGLRKLGFEVCFVEQIDDAACVDADGVPSSFEESANLRYFQWIVSRFGLEGSAALLRSGGDPGFGLSLREVCDIAGSSAALVNISGHLKIEAIRRGVRRKIYVDEDPGYTQFWAASGSAMGLDGHDVYLTVGENVGRAECEIPTVGRDWIPQRRFVVLDDWPVSRQGDASRFTTVAAWRGAFGAVEYLGRRFGLKAHEFRKVIDLPTLAAQEFEVALSIHPADAKDLDALRSHGWRIVDPQSVARNPLAFREYVQGSGGEFSVAQGIYVETHSGWMSDRTVLYLASGKPALVQDTGFRRNYPVGEGLVPFTTLEEAVAGAKRIAADYSGHAAAARAFAEEFLDSDKVLQRLLERCGIEC